MSNLKSVTPTKLNQPERFFAFAIFLGCTSSLIALILIKLGIHTDKVFAIKDGPIYLGALLLAKFWLNNRTAFTHIITINILTISMLINFLVLNNEYIAPVNNIRQIVAPLVLLVVFCSLSIRPQSYDELLRKLCTWTCFVFGFGFIEQSLELWRHADLSQYFALKGIPTDEFGMSFMFYEPAFNYRERMTSSFLDPISLGHFFATMAIFLYYRKGRNKLENITYYLCLVGMLLALSKGAIIQFFIGVIFLNGRLPAFIKAIGAIGVSFLIYLLPDKTGLMTHVHGFINSVDSLTYFGYGIGSVGNYAKMFSDDLTLYYALDISDSYAGAMLGQIGFVGFLTWTSLAFFIISTSSQYREGFINGSRLFISIFTVSILSENTMNVTSFLMPALIIALAIKTKPATANNHNSKELSS